MDAYQYHLRLPSGRNLKIIVDKSLSQRDLAWLQMLVVFNEHALNIAFQWTTEETISPSTLIDLIVGSNDISVVTPQVPENA